eukprot:507655-Karenia_brevis.AAC.1
MSLHTCCDMLRRLNLFWTKAICMSATFWVQTAEYLSRLIRVYPLYSICRPLKPGVCKSPMSF